LAYAAVTASSGRKGDFWAVEKANNRKGGVGTETQIITPDI
jgi:hypothetical protein